MTRDDIWRRPSSADSSEEWQWQTDANHLFIKMSSRQAGPIEHVLEHSTGKALIDLTTENTEEEKWQSHLADLSGRKPFHDFHFMLHGDDGRIRHLAYSGAPNFDDSGDFIGFQGSGRIIPAVVETKYEPADAQRQFMAAIESVSDGFALFDPEDRMVMCNNRFKAFNPNLASILEPGITFEDMLRDNIAHGRIMDIGDEEAFIAERKHRHQNPSDPIVQKRADGRWLELREEKMPDGSIFLINTDITQRKNTEQALFESNERYRNLAEGSLQGILVHRDLKPLYANEALQDIFGYRSIEDIINIESIADLVDDEEKDAMLRLVQARSEGKETPAYSEFKGVRADGSTVWFESSARPIRWDGEMAIQATVMDTSERHRVVETQRRLVTAIDGVAEIVSIYDADDKLIYCNEMLRQIEHLILDTLQPGVTFEERIRAAVTKNKPIDAVGREDAWVEERLNRHRNPGQPFEITRQDGSTLLLREQKMADGSTISIGTDITQNRKMEEQIRRAQKMEAVGQLTGGIAHDFNNILGVILGNLQLLERRLDDRENMQFLQAAIVGTQRGASITKKLLSFAGKKTGDVTQIAVNDVVRSMQDLIGRSLTARINVKTHLLSNLWPVRIDPNDFEDAVLNLSLNARDAMPNGGALLIETANKFLDKKYVASNPSAVVGEYVLISVSDTGTGMADDIAQRVFDPFFTTKETGRGTGLGLSMVYGFVERAGGHIKIYTELGSGTTFNIYLPRDYDGNTKSKSDIGRKIVAPRGGETVLVVDDEEPLALVARTYLELLGYKTVIANFGKQALDVLQNRQDIDLVFCDVIMPGGLDGYRVAIAARKMRPDLKVLLTSGFTKNHEEYVNGDGEYLTKLTRNLLSKPYNHVELAFAVRRTLDDDEG